MKLRALAFTALFVCLLPSGARADTFGAPFASDTHFTQCQWIAAQAKLGTCQMAAAARRSTGALAVDARMLSPDSPAGKNTLPTWGQAVAQASVTNGFYLPEKATSITFTATLHISKISSTIQGTVPTLGWVQPTASIDVRGIDCRCANQAMSRALAGTETGQNIVRSVTVDGHFAPGTFIVSPGFVVVAGLKNTPGMSRMTIYGAVTKIVVSYVAGD